MGDILFPDNWDKSLTDESGYQLKVELNPTEAEYWDVFDKLTAPTDCGYGMMGGSDDDDDGTWLSELHRIQNPYLYTYVTFEPALSKRLLTPSRYQTRECVPVLVCLLCFC